MSDAGVEPAQRPFWKRKGCILGAIGALGLLALLCLAAAIVVPSLGNPSISKSRQKRAVGEVRSIAVAVQSYQTDHTNAPLPPGVHPGSGWSYVPASDLKPVLTPDYIKEIPQTDPWGQPYLYGYTLENPEWFCVLSTGKDGVRDSRDLPQSPSATHCYESDIIWLNGEFLQYPEGKQGKCGKGGG